MAKSSYFIFHGSLNDFLSFSEQGEDIKYAFFGSPTIKDAIEAQGIPHTEIGLMYINGTQVAFDYKLQADDHAEVFPIHNPFAEHTHFQFVIDSHLGKLAMDLRVLGFDSLYEKNYTQEKIAHIAQHENRVVLTRNIGLLKNNRIRKGYWIRSQEPKIQVQEVINYFNLKDKILPFSRCRICNGLIKQVSKERVEDQLPKMTKAHFHEFYQCAECHKVYWKGSHYEKMVKFVEKLTKTP